MKSEEYKEQYYDEFIKDLEKDQKAHEEVVKEWETINKEVVSSRLKEIRKKRDLTMSELAGICGVAYTTIQRYETNNVKYMQLKMIDKICKGLNIDVEYILGHRNVIQDYIEKDPILYADDKLLIRMYSIGLHRKYFKHTIYNYCQFGKEFGNYDYVEIIQGIRKIYGDKTTEMLLIMDKFYSEEVSEKDRNLIRAILELPEKK